MHIFSNKTATSLNKTGLVAYPVRGVLENFMYSFRPSLNENSHSIAGHMPVKCTVPKATAGVFSEAKRSTRYSLTETEEIDIDKSSAVKSRNTGRYLRMSLLYTVFENSFDHLNGCGGISINMKIGDGLELYCFPVIVPYFYGIPERQHVSMYRV